MPDCSQKTTRCLTLAGQLCGYKAKLTRHTTSYLYERKAAVLGPKNSFRFDEIGDVAIIVDASGVESGAGSCESEPRNDGESNGITRECEV